MSDSEISEAIGAAGWPAGWRDEWEMREASVPAPQAWHRSGLCFFFEFEQIDGTATGHGCVERRDFSEPPRLAMVGTWR